MREIPNHIKKNLEGLSKEQLIYLIWAYRNVDSWISETLVSVSKMELDPEDAICKIRSYLSEIDWITLYDKNLGTDIDFEIGKISAEERREKVLGK